MSHPSIFNHHSKQHRCCLLALRVIFKLDGITCNFSHFHGKSQNLTNRRRSSEGWSLGTIALSEFLVWAKVSFQLHESPKFFCCCLRTRIRDIREQGANSVKILNRQGQSGRRTGARTSTFHLTTQNTKTGHI